MEHSPYLKPMGSDSLRQKAPQNPVFSPMCTPMLTWDVEPTEPEFVFADAPVPETTLPPQEAEPAMEWPPAPSLPDEDDEDEPVEDAIPTEQMPLPVCVSLTAFPPPPKPAKQGGWLVLLCVLCTLAGMALALGMGGFGLWL